MKKNKKMNNEVILAESTLIDGFSAEQGRFLAEYWKESIPVGSGIALIPVYGPLDNVASFFGFDVMSYPELSSKLKEAVDSEGISSIVLLINSPGGVVSGLYELCDQIKAACGKKKVVSMITGYGCSAAYAIACSASEVYIEKDAMTGSCGAYTECISYDPEYMKREEGILSRIFRSANAPKKNADPVTDKSAAEDTQARIDKAGETYLSYVAGCRGIDKKKCEETFGQGAIVDADYALANGMVDGIMSYVDLINSLSEKGAANSDESEGADMDIMKMSAEEKQELFKALTEADPDLLATSREEAVKAEQERVMQMVAMKTGDKEHDAIIDSAIADGGDVNALKCSLFDYMASHKEQEKIKPEIHSEVLKALADSDQVVNPASIDSAEERFQQIMKQVKEARR